MVERNPELWWFMHGDRSRKACSTGAEILPNSPSFTGDGPWKVWWLSSLYEREKSGRHTVLGEEDGFWCSTSATTTPNFDLSSGLPIRRYALKVHQSYYIRSPARVVCHGHIYRTPARLAGRRGGVVVSALRNIVLPTPVYLMPRSISSACIALPKGSRPNMLISPRESHSWPENVVLCPFTTHLRLFCPGVQILVATMRLSAVPVSLLATAAAALQNVQYGALYEPEHPFPARGGNYPYADTDWGDTSLPTATYSVANQLGFFTANGLNVTFNQVASSTDAFNSILNGQYDILTATVDNALNYRFNQNQNVTVLGQLDQGPDLVIASVPSITNLSQLKGKDIIVDSPSSGYSFLIQYVLAKAGLTLANGDYSFTVGLHHYSAVTKRGLLTPGVS